MMLDLLPQMTHPLSTAWNQPPTTDIAFYDDIAIMDRPTLDLLPEYSTSIPTGVYEGKMWRRALLGEGWVLCWYGPADDPDKCSINSRPIRLIRNKEETVWNK